MGMFKRIIAAVLVAAMLWVDLPTAALASMLEEAKTEAVQAQLEENGDPAMDPELPEEEPSEESGVPDEPEGILPGAEDPGMEPGEGAGVEEVPAAVPEELDGSAAVMSGEESGEVMGPVEEVTPEEPPAEEITGWDLDGDGLLTVTDAAAMAAKPWQEYMESITAIVIGEGITGISDSAFDGAVNLSLVILPDSLQTIGDYAFRGCMNLSDILVPENVTQVGQSAFAGCANLTMIRFLGYDVTIGENAFEGVSSQLAYPYDSEWETDENYGGNLTWLGYERILGTGTYDTSRWLAGENGTMEIVGIGTLRDQSSAAGYPWHNYADTVGYLYCSGPDNLPDYAFAGFSNLSSASLYYLDSVGAGAFSGCGNLRQVYFAGCPEIASNTFQGVTATINYQMEHGWTEDQMQNYGGNLTWMTSYSGTYGEGIYWDLSGEQLMFYSMDGTYQTMESQSSAEDYPWYAHRDRIAWVTLSNVSAGDYAFDGYPALNSLDIYGEMNLGSCAFRDCAELNTIFVSAIPGKIAEDAFTGVTAEVTYEGGFGWRDSNRLNYGGSLTWKEFASTEPMVASGTHGDNATWTLSKYGELTVTGEGEMANMSSAEDYGWYAYRDQIEWVIVDGLTSVGDYAFAGYPVLSRLEILESVTKVGSHILDGSASVDNVAFGGLPPQIAVDALEGLENVGILYPHRYEEQWQTETGNTYGATDVWWSMWTRSIDFGRFSGGYWNMFDDGMLDIAAMDGQICTIADTDPGQTPWGDYTEFITSVNMTGVSYIGENAFAGCTSLKFVQVDEALEGIGENAFQGVTATVWYTGDLDSALMQNYGGTLTWEERYNESTTGWWEGIEFEFRDTGDLYLRADEPVEMPDMESSDGYPWHEYADRVTNIHLYNITSIGDYAFAGFTGLTEFQFDIYVTKLGNHIFDGCTNLSWLSFDGDAPEFSENTFYGVTATVTFYPSGDPSWTEDKLQNYGGSINWGGTDSDEVTWTMENGVLTIYGSGPMEDYAYEGAPWYTFRREIRQVEILPGVTSIGTYAFEDCSVLESISIPASVTQIGAHAFSACCELREITLPEGITIIPSRAFSGCVNLSGITIPESVTQIGYAAFMSCFIGLTEITIPENVTSIGGMAFYGCSALNSITMEGDAPSIGNDALSGVTATVYYPAGNTTWTDAVKGQYGGTITWAARQEAGNEIGGLCGDTLYWALDDEGVLTISGTGMMYEFSPVEDAQTGTTYIPTPWRRYAEQIRTVVLDSGVGSVTDCIFMNEYPNLETVYMSETVVRIGRDSFASANMSAYVVAENNPHLSSVDGVLFDKAKTKLLSYPCGKRDSSYTIPDSVTMLQPEILGGTVYLQELIIPASVENIYTLRETSLLNFRVDPENANFCDIDGVLFTKDGGQLANYPSGRQNTEYAVPEGTWCIQDFSFRCPALTRVLIPVGVDQIAFDAFQGVEEIVFMGDAPQWGLGPNAFNGNGETTVFYPENNPTWTEEILQSVGSNVTWVPYFDGIASGECGENLSWTLSTDGILTVSGTGAMTDYEYDTVPWIDYRNDILQVVISEGVTYIGSYAFYECKALIAVEIAGSVTGIGAEAFSWCEGLNDLTIPYGVVEIGEGAFAWCRNLTSVTIPDSVTDIGDQAFTFCDKMPAVTIPGSVTRIGAGAFSGCAKLTTVTVPASVTSIGAGAFASCHGLTQILVEPGNAHYCSDASGVLFDKNMTQLLQAPGAISGVYSIPESVTDIADNAFASYRNLTGIVIPEGVTSIGETAFSGCSALIEVTIPGTVTDVGYGAFYGCTGLTSVTVRAGVSVIGEDMFGGCTGLTTITMEGDAPVIGEYALSGVTATAYYPEGNATWTEDKLQQYGGTITWIAYEKVIDSGTCGSELTWTLSSTGTLTISGSGDMFFYDIMNMRPEWYWYASEVKRIVIEEGVTSVGEYAFYGDFGNVTEIELPDSLVSIGSHAFEDCKNVTELTFGENLESIGMYAFIGMDLTGTLTLPDSLKAIDMYAFNGCGGLTGLELGNGLESIGGYAFANCSGITGTVTFPETILSIGGNAFAGCSGVAHVRFEAVNCPNITNNSLGNLGGLKSVYVPGENYASYEAFLAKLPAAVEIRTDWEYFPVTGLTADTIYSRTAVLHWDAHISGKAAGYIVLRDGVKIGTTTQCAYTDRELEPDETYRYTVQAYFADDLVAEESEVLEIKTVLPEITGLSGYQEFAGIRHFAESNNTVLVTVADKGNLAPLGYQKATVALYCDRNGEEMLIGTVQPEQSDSGTVTCSIVWDLSTWSDGVYTLRAVLTDVDGTTAVRTEEITVDNTPPAKLEQLVVTGEETAINLSWTEAKEYNAVGYHVYRSVGDQNNFQRLADIEGRNTLSYTDTTASETEVCYYYVVAVDIFGREAREYDILGGSRVTDTVKPRVLQLLPVSGSYLTGEVTFRMKAEDNVAVTGTKLEYSLDKGASWTEVQEAEGAYVLDTRTLADGEITVRAFAWDEAGNESDAFTQTYAIDNTGPGQVVWAEHVSTSVTLTLRWENVPDADIGGFRVEQKQSDGTYKVIAESVTALGYNLRGLIPGTEYTFRVTAYDQFGNLGEPSEPYTASTGADITAPVTVQILPASGVFAGTIALSATVEDDYSIASAALEYSVDQIGWTTLCSETYHGVEAVRKISGQLDLEQIPEGFLYVRATATDHAGNVMAEPVFVQHMIDRTAPVAPTNVTAKGGSGYIEIRWDSVADAAGYQIWRAEAESETFVQLADGHGSLNYTDRTVEDGIVYRYRVAAADTAGNVGEFGEIVSAQAENDTVAPEILSVSPGDGSILSSYFAQVSTLVKDNRELYSITLEYSHDGTAYTALTQLKDINAYGTTAAGTIPVAEFAHGDTVWLRATAADSAGNVCEPLVCTYTVDTQAPLITDVTARYADGAVTLEWTGGNEADLAGYRIYRRADGTSTLLGQVPGEAGRTAYTWMDDSLPLTGGTFSYQIEAVDQVGNTATGSASEGTPGANTPVVVVPERTGPTALLTCDAVMTTNVEYLIDGSGSTDDGQIISYEYNFGDGTTGTGKSLIHTYTQEGRYKLSLTVTDNDGQSHTFSRWITVKAPELVGKVSVRIVDEKGAPVPDAPVYFDLGDEEKQVIRGTDGNGYVTFTAEVGRHTVGCVILNNQWLPVKRDLIVKAGETTSVSMTLVNKPIVEGTFEIKRMTLEEIEAAGIDLTDPANQYYVEVVLHLVYENTELTTTIPGGALGGGRIIFDPSGKYKPKKEDDDDDDPIIIGDDDDDDDDDDDEIRGWYIELIDKSEDPKLMILDIPIGVRSLKEMFDVRLHILNNSSSDFSMKDNVIKLDLPSGLSVLTDAYMANPQTVKVAEIPGQTQKTVEWIVRGDQPGEYMIGADYSGILSQFNEPLTARFDAKDPIEVYGMSGMKLTLLYADELANGTLYYNVMLTNEGEVDIYKPAISTEDILLEMELYDETGMMKAEMMDYSAEGIAKIPSIKTLSTLPDILKVGDSLVMHYMCIDQTDYTQCEMKLKDASVQYQNTYGLENVELKSKPLSYFMENFSTDINPVEKANNSHSGAKGAYDQLVENSRYMCWALARDMIADNYLPSDLDELEWEAINGDGLKGRSKDIKQAQALILEVLKLSAAASSEFQSEIGVKFLKTLKKIVPNLPTEFLGISEKQKEALMSAMVDVTNEHYKELAKTKKPMDGLIITVWEQKCKENGVEFVGDKKAKNVLHKIYSDNHMEEFWKGIGIGADLTGKILESLEETVVDVNVYLAAQANINTHLMLLDTMILYTDTPEMEALYHKEDTWIVVDALTRVRKTIQDENIMGKLVDHVLLKVAQEAQGKAVDWATDKILDVAGATVSGIFTLVTKTLELTAKGLDLLMNISEQYKMADNIRFVAIMSEATVWALEDAWSQYESYGIREDAEDYMKLLALLLDLRALGESQVALYGKSFETDFTVGNLKLLKAVRAESDAHQATSWYQWRDIVEDRISRLRAQLLKNPLTTEVTGRNQPTVSFDYTTGQTIQSFSSDYEYSLDKGATWMVCKDGPIYVERPVTMQELWVRKVDRKNTDMTDTAILTVYGSVSLSTSRIEVLKTETGYRINNLENSKNYRVTFSETPISYTYDDQLETQLPAGSTSYEHITDKTYPYVYIRALADRNGFASEITRVPISSMVKLTVKSSGEGVVMEVPETWEYGAEVSVTAVPVEGYGFEGWYRSGTRVCRTETYTFTIYGTTYLEARFTDEPQKPLPGVSAYINAEDGSASVTTGEGTTVTITGAPENADMLVVETVADAQIQTEVTGWMGELGTPDQILKIYMVDAGRNPIALSGETVTLSQAEPGNWMMLCTATNGTVELLDVRELDGRFTFEGNGSEYYVLASLPMDRRIRVETSEQELMPGQQALLTAEFLPVNYTGTQILWSLAEGSENYATLVSDSEGAVVTAKLTAVEQKVTVTASAADSSFPSTSLEIRVVPFDGEIEVTSENDVYELLPGKSTKLTAKFLPENFTGTKVVWSLAEGDELYATLKASGETAVLTALAVTGGRSVTVTAAAADGSVPSGSVVVQVVPNVYQVDIYRGETKVTGGKFRFDVNGDTNYLELTADVAPADATQELNWTSSNTEIAEVTQNGLVTFLGKTGTVKITAAATDGSKKSAAVTVEVVALPQKIEMAEDSVTELLGGKSATFKVVDTATGLEPDAKILWSMDEEYAPYATLTAAGKLTTRAVAEETEIVITACVEGNEERAFVNHKVTIRPKVSYLEIYHDEQVVNNETILVDTAGATETDLPTVELEAVHYPGDALSGITWKSLNTGIADVETDPVTGNAIVTVKWNAKKQACMSGTVTIQATAADGSKVAATVKLNVGVFVKKIYIEAPELSLRSGQKMTLTAETDPAAPTKGGVTWSLEGEDDANFATITSAGRLTAKTVYDTHMVTVRATAKDGSGIFAEAYVEIAPKTDNILTILSEDKNLTKQTVSLDLDNENQITLEARTLGDYVNEDVTWSLSSAKYAELVPNEDGSCTVTVNSGAVTVTAKAADGRSATVTLKGVRMVQTIDIGTKTGIMEVASGKYINLTAAVTPSNATNKGVVWSIAAKDADYATISTAGKLTAAKNLMEDRIITVIATAKDGGGAVQTAEVLLTPLATSISLLLNGVAVENTTQIQDMMGNDTLYMEAKVYPLNEAGSSVTWKSSNKKIASIDENGVITCLKAGTVTITATANDGSKKTATFKLKVEKWMTELSLPDTAVIAGSKTLTMTKLAGYVLDSGATNKTLIWTMEGEGAAFATLSNKGVLKTKKVTEPKVLTVTATAADPGGISASCEVTIYPLTTKVQILCDGAPVTSTLTLEVGDSLQLEGSSLPVSAASAYTWKTSAVKYAEVDENGIVTAVKTGKTVSITCTAADGSGRGAVVKIKIVEPQ